MVVSVVILYCMTNSNSVILVLPFAKLCVSSALSAVQEHSTAESAEKAQRKVVAKKSSNPKSLQLVADSTTSSNSKNPKTFVRKKSFSGIFKQLFIMWGRLKNPSTFFIKRFVSEINSLFASRPFCSCPGMVRHHFIPIFIILMTICFQ